VLAEDFPGAYPSNGECYKETVKRGCPVRMRCCSALLALALAGVCPFGPAQGDSLNEVIKSGPISGDLASALARVAWLSQKPMIAELAQPLPRIEIADGPYVVKDLLHEIARQAPGYEWQAEGEVIHFYNAKLRRARLNFLNLTFPRFIMPPNLSDLKLTFSTREFALLHGYTGTGIVTSGFGDALLEKDSLRPETLENVTGRDIVFRVANESPTFFTIIVFPDADPTKEQMETDVNLNWFWGSLKEKPSPLFVQLPKDKGEAH
jgi:hypothetical protein